MLSASPTASLNDAQLPFATDADVSHEPVTVSGATGMEGGKNSVGGGDGGGDGGGKSGECVAGGSKGGEGGEEGNAQMMEGSADCYYERRT